MPNLGLFAVPQVMPSNATKCTKCLFTVKVMAVLGTNKRVQMEMKVLSNLSAAYDFRNGGGLFCCCLETDCNCQCWENIQEITFWVITGLWWPCFARGAPHKIAYILLEMVNYWRVVIKNCFSFINSLPGNFRGQRPLIYAAGFLMQQSRHSLTCC